MKIQAFLLSALLCSVLGQTTQAATLTATSTTPQFFSGFTVTWDDTNNDGILQASEFGALPTSTGFSGQTIDGTLYTRLFQVPNIAGLTEGFSVLGDSNVWYVTTPDGQFLSGVTTDRLTYSLSAETAVPEPTPLPGLLGLAVAFGGALMLRRHREVAKSTTV